ncbi:MAG TPA: CHAT domain-containing protein [Thermoanaerobaculia bacterium]
METKRSLQFEELALRIQRGGDGRCVVQVTHSPYGSKASHFSLSDSIERLPGLIRATESTLRTAGVKRQINLSSEDLPPALTPEAVGDKLFRGLFSDSVLETLLLSLGRVEAEPDKGLRIRLTFDPSLPGLTEISALPWELLYRAETRDFLGRNPLTPLVRYLEVPRLSTPAPLTSSLSILAVVSSPSDEPALDLKKECQRLEDVLGQQANIKIQFLENPTLLSLRTKLMSTPFHVFHFMGHGGFDERTGEGALLFVNPQGKSMPVSGRVLAEVFKDSRSLRLAFLNACDTAQLPRHRGQDPFSGVASALVMAGLPAVIAMQFPISDQAAQVFSQHFYTALVTGFPVDAAAAEARLAIHLTDPGSWEWATPALFMSVPDGRIILPAAEIEESPTAREPHPAGPIQANTTGASGGITIGGVGNAISGGVHLNQTGKKG